MNAFLFGTISMGLMLVGFTRPSADIETEALYAAHDAEVARLMEAAPDQGLMGPMSITDPETGERIPVDVIAFND